jgi:Flp pilus assembly protein TadG
VKKSFVFRVLCFVFSRRDKGTVSITFMLSLPIFLFIIGAITQYTLMVNARLTLDRALAAAARSAMTALPSDPTIEQMDGEEYVRKSACMVLAPISPEAANVTPTAAAVYSALQKLNTGVVNTYDKRYSFAQDPAATLIKWERVDSNDQTIPEPQWTPADFSARRGMRVKLTIAYKFRLTIPAVRLAGTRETIAGVDGYYATLSNSIIVQLSPGRKAASDGHGWPN